MAFCSEATVHEGTGGIVLVHANQHSHHSQVAVAGSADCQMAQVVAIELRFEQVIQVDPLALRSIAH